VGHFKNLKMNPKLKPITTSFSSTVGQRDRLLALAKKHNCWRAGKPNLSGLFSKLADGDLVLNSTVKDPQQIEPLVRAIKLLGDNGLGNEAQQLGRYLLEYNLSPQQRATILPTVHNLGDGWRQQIDTFIDAKSSFTIVYTNGQGELEEFSVEYAQVDFVEKRFYLNCWVREEGENDFSQLAHNRCFRFDRIAGLRELGGEWRTEGLGTIEILLKFRHGLVKGYERRVNDIEDRIEDRCRFIRREINNPFWSIREILRYGSGCELLEPEILRDRLRQELISNLSLYPATHNTVGVASSLENSELPQDD
jgi:predicted DNA-binding transcriptional regulator YafY